MALSTCNQSGVEFVYDLDTNLFNESIFKMCTECGVFTHDFSQLFCDCGHKLDYVNVSDIDTLKKWLSEESKNSESKNSKSVKKNQ